MSSRAGLVTFHLCAGGVASSPGRVLCFGSVTLALLSPGWGRSRCWVGSALLMHGTAHTGDSTICCITVAHLFGRSWIHFFICLGCCTSPACNVGFWLCCFIANTLSHRCCVSKAAAWLGFKIPQNQNFGIAERGERLLRLWVGPSHCRVDGDRAELLPTCTQCRVAISHPCDQVLPNRGLVLVMGT